MTEAGSPRKATWWREVLIALIVGFVVTAYYSAKLTHAEQRAQQVEARLKQLESPSSPQLIITNEQMKQDGTRQEQERQKWDAPQDLRCPYGTALQRVISEKYYPLPDGRTLELPDKLTLKQRADLRSKLGPQGYEQFQEYMATRTHYPKGTDWECVSEPMHREPGF